MYLNVLDATFALGFWYGMKLVAEGKSDSSAVVSILFAVIIGIVANFID